MCNTTVGTCGNCGGPVTVPSVWYGIYPPKPQCQGCGATPKEAHGPVLPMNEKRWENNQPQIIPRDKPHA